MIGIRSAQQCSAFGHRSKRSNLERARSIAARGPPAEPATHSIPQCSMVAARCSVIAQGMQAATQAEAEANEKRREEAGNVGSSDEWSWTLNWDSIPGDNITVGSCPRSPSDLDRLVEEAGIDAVLCLQSELCHEALQIDWERIRQHAVTRGVLMTRVAVRDFDHGDQALMLPEAVRTLYLLLSMGKKVYVHCTAGINRATLTVVGYLTFVKGKPLEEAVHHVKSARSQAHPYIDCWRTVRSRLTEGRAEELMGLAKAIYKGREAEGKPGSSSDDWTAAENLLIKETFQRQLGCMLSLVSNLKDLQEARLDALTCLSANEMRLVSDEMKDLRHEVDKERAQYDQVAKELAAAREEVAMLRQAANAEGPEMLAELDALKSARSEISALRSTIQQVARSTITKLQGEVPASVDRATNPAAFLEPNQPDTSPTVAAAGAGNGTK